MAASILALDVGQKRIGVAVASNETRLARPLTTIIRSDSVAGEITALVAEHQASGVVIGLPRGLDGQETEQTRLVKEFGGMLEQGLDLPIYWQDEAVTSRQAEAELQSRGKPYQKSDIDSLSATYILEDFIQDHPEAMA